MTPDERAKLNDIANRLAELTQEWNVEAMRNRLGDLAGEVRAMAKAAELAEPDHPAEAKPAPDQPPPNKYLRTINARCFDTLKMTCQVDVIDIINAYELDYCLGQALKKILCAGQRGHKDRATDLREAIDAIRRAE